MLSDLLEAVHVLWLHSSSKQGVHWSMPIVVCGRCCCAMPFPLLGVGISVFCLYFHLFFFLAILFLPIMLKILFEVSIFYLKLSYIASYLTVTLCTLYTSFALHTTDSYS